MQVVLFAGTTEGRLIGEALSEKHIPTIVCVATKEGAEIIGSKDYIEIRVGRLDSEAMIKLAREAGADLVIDATHPYAVDVSSNIKKAALVADIDLIRVVRDETSVIDYDKAFYFDDLDEMISWLNNEEGLIFSTLGSKEASALTGVDGFMERVYLRVLPNAESIELCRAAGFPDEHILGLRPPFTREVNEKLFSEYKCSIMITKETGVAGGMANKVEAAINLGMKIGICRRPSEDENITKMSLEKIIDYISNL